MIDSLSIENFRGISQGELIQLRPLSILIGPNNSGKSTALEGLFVGSTGSSPAAVRVLKRRAWIGLAGLRDSFYAWALPECWASFTIGRGGAGSTVRLGVSYTRDADLVKHVRSELEVAGTVQLIVSGAQGSQNCLIHEDGRVSTVLGTPAAERAELLDVGTITSFGTLEDSYSTSVARGAHVKPALLELTRAMRPDTRDLEILKRDERYILCLMDERGSSALYYAGDGLKRLFHVAATLAGNPGGLLLLEEPEAFQHPASLELLARLLLKGIDQGSQVILSTHSLELVRALLDFAEHRREQMGIYRTRLAGGRFDAALIPGPEAWERLDELGEDLRR
ncbi:MAG: AAA family ATPase [Candidatus Eremiobacterota bacterium]